MLNATAFVGNKHPEFYTNRGGYSDPSKIKFNHQVHIALGGCESCHTAAALADAAAKDSKGIATLRPGTSVNAIGGAYMAPLKFADHCATCHADKLEFDKAILEDEDSEDFAGAELDELDGRGRISALNTGEEGARRGDAVRGSGARLRRDAALHRAAIGSRASSSI